MPPFRPRCSDVLSIGGTPYQFMPHPLFPADDEMPFAIESSEAIIFQMGVVDGDALFALKVPKPSFRHPAVEQMPSLLAHVMDLSGCRLARRAWLLPATDAPLLATHPALLGASLMPWVAGTTWATVMQRRDTAPLYATLLGWAAACSQTLGDLEARGLAHTDIAGSNVMVLPAAPEVVLLDLERMYAPTAPHPPGQGLGTRGYQHPHQEPTGQWCPAGDRFAGAVLLTEMLIWGDPRVRASVLAGAESVFHPAEMGVIGTPVWWAVRRSLWEHWPDLLPLFDAAWDAPSLAACPPLASWAQVVGQYVDRERYAAGQMINAIA